MVFFLRISRIDFLNWCEVICNKENSRISKNYQTKMFFFLGAVSINRRLNDVFINFNCIITIGLIRVKRINTFEWFNFDVTKLSIIMMKWLKFLSTKLYEISLNFRYPRPKWSHITDKFLCKFEFNFIFTFISKPWVQFEAVIKCAPEFIDGGADGINIIHMRAWKW